MLIHTSILSLFNEEMSELHRVLATSLMIKLAVSKSVSTWVRENFPLSPVNHVVSMAIT
jgi:hypothetical protein